MSFSTDMARELAKHLDKIMEEELLKQVPRSFAESFSATEKRIGEVVDMPPGAHIVLKGAYTGGYVEALTSVEIRLLHTLVAVRDEAAAAKAKLRELEAKGEELEEATT